jgi:hypothetical protein
MTLSQSHSIKKTPTPTTNMVAIMVNQQQHFLRHIFLFAYLDLSLYV